jgi:hypothetical protein
VELSEHVIRELRAKAEDSRLSARRDWEPWRRTEILRFARDGDLLADEYQHQLRRRQSRDH